MPGYLHIYIGTGDKINLLVLHDPSKETMKITLNYPTIMRKETTSAHLLSVLVASQSKNYCNGTVSIAVDNGTH